MSGHSHAKTVQHTKEAAAKKRGKIFSKLSRVISLVSKNGGDPSMNPGLRMAIEQAKRANMPNENIERAIKKGTGELEGETLEEFCFEAYGPAKSALIILGITSNRNRALGEIKQILIHHNAKLAESGSVKWQFKNMGIITIDPGERKKEKIEMMAIEAGADDIEWKNDSLEIYADPSKLEEVKKKIETKGLNIKSNRLGWVAKEKINVDEKEKLAIEKLLSSLSENDDVHDIFSNTKS
ncbi:MAG: YebC/PmpR family DNA-binding transcriptional regulator [Patescibacteria group bacterium]|nr:YebC/PmpR family DNA-binding transcriptional regulator [Patescibacteria group bacterium]